MFRYVATACRPRRRTVVTSSLGQTRIRATSSFRPAGPNRYGTTCLTSSAESHTAIAPSACSAASSSIGGRNAAIRMGGATRGTRSRRNPLMVNVSKSSLTRSPAKARRRKRTVSRMRASGRSKWSPFHCSTMTGDETPSPRTNRPDASSASDAAVMASVAAPRVKTGTIAVPSLARGARTDATASGENASALAASLDQRSV